MHICVCHQRPTTATDQTAITRKLVADFTSLRASYAASETQYRREIVRLKQEIERLKKDRSNRELKLPIREVGVEQLLHVTCLA